MRFDHPREPSPANGFIYPIGDKVVYYVTRDEYVTLSLLFYGSVGAFLIGVLLMGVTTHQK